MNAASFCLLSALAAAPPELPPPTLRPMDFSRDVEPILRAHCIECHGSTKQKGEYRLDAREPALRGGDSVAAPIVPGRSAESPLIRFIAGLDADMLMPPAGSGKGKLTPAQVSSLRAWIDQGARWPDKALKNQGSGRWWSLAPLTPRVPPGSGRPVDAFIRATLREKGLAPSPEADRRTLIRRLYFDLLGLPPTPQQVDAFVADSGPNAYERLVDALLASPRYGEAWARHWLDVVNYADTHGNDHDYARPNAWPYRDYVVRSLNEDKPYSRFVKEQIAGDALFPDDPQATAALGFLAAGPWDDTLMATIREDTVDHRMAQNLDRDGMVGAVMSTFQSLTVHCARCHNHKFDPVSQREYYGLQAVFAGVDRAERLFDDDSRTHVRRQKLLASKRLLEEPSANSSALNSPEAQRKVAAAAEEFATRAAEWIPLNVINVVSVQGTEGTRFARQRDGSWLVRGARPDKDCFIVTAQTKLQGLQALRLEVLPDESLPFRGPGRYDNGNFHLSEFRATVQPATGPTDGAVKLEFAHAFADHADAGGGVANAVDGSEQTHWSIHPRYGEPHEAVFELKRPAGFAVGTTLTVMLDFKGTSGHQIGRFRLSACTDSSPPDRRAPIPAPLAALLRKPAAARTPADRWELARLVLLLEVERELAKLPAARLVYAATKDFPPQGSFKPSATPRPIYLLQRGDVNKPGELVGPAALQCLPELSGEFTAPMGEESARRAALATWIADKRNVLTWRSIVNRVWCYHFGRGLCDTPNDFGKMGGGPSHPELLDWLALWFRDDAKGSLKALHRLLLTSAVYRQTSTNGSGSSVDGEDHLLWRMYRPRLTAEQIRDAVLQFSGRLDLTMGGPPVAQFAHRGKATFMPDGGAPAFLDYEGIDPDAPQHRRRSLYRFLFRTVPDPFMDALDCPDGAALTPVRNVSTTPLQAFAMLNDAFLLRQCERIAARLAVDAATPELKAAAAFRLILLRSPQPAESDRFAAYIRRHGLANACHVLLNCNEFVYID